MTLNKQSNQQNVTFIKAKNQGFKGGVGNFGETGSRSLDFENTQPEKNLPLPYRAPPPTHTNAHMTNEGTR